MVKYRRSIVKEVEALTFEEFVEYGKRQSGVIIVDGMPQSFEYKGNTVTRETDDQYLIKFSHALIDFNKNKGELIVTEGDDTFIVSEEMFHSTHDKIEN